MRNEQLRSRCGATFFARVASVVTTSLLAYLSVAGAPPGVSEQTDVIPTPTPTLTATPALALATDTPTPSETPVVVETPVPTITPTPFVSGVPCDGGDPSGPDGVLRSERRGQDEDDNRDDDEFRSGNGHNEVVVHNCTDRRLRVRASIQLNTIPGRTVRPLNLAYAEGSCLECQTFAVALQIDLYSQRANDVRPENYAVAINTGCTRCVTVARAIQYVQAVDNPDDVSEDIADTVNRLDRELRSIQRDQTISLAEAEARLNGVLERFNELGGSLGDQRDERDD